MRRIQLGIGAVVSALTLAGVVIAVASMTAQQPPPQLQAQACLHSQNESADQRGRRMQALRLTRQINSLQNEAHVKTQAYQGIAGLAALGIPPAGFDVHLATDGRSYALLVKDTVDPCGFAFFSDQEGLIYAGQPIQ